MLMYWKIFKDSYLGEKGQGMVEYAVILAFVAIVAVSFTNGGALSAAIGRAITAVTAVLP
ncbi:Flp family type IVb pilin [Anaerosinus massiliensis]|uniref:Flp family type IVb pilin n=1 Tax=Massilibacillus massiliensis TaxID=1806837 RepID=UPI000ADAED88|nr:hypothetical protein [Massilibacillus massiliensis]